MKKRYTYPALIKPSIDKEAHRLVMELREERSLRRMLYDFMIEHELPMGMCVTTIR